MTAIEEALAELSGSLEGKRVPYMLVGGLAKAITRRRAESLDFAYLEPRIRALSVELEKPEIIQRWEDWKGDAQGPRTED